ncbi:MAG: hypothetical protein QMD46_01535 [Methanomicrobiales archaeon]|nr:hypothetical protein [Methanomicrobiales archaeon]MDI6875779.1 hypothetical protein [Methanomicrobiales archaeon]
MKIGIIVHSETGNTLAVARQLQEGLRAAGHTAETKRLKLTGKPQDRNVGIVDPPDAGAYEGLVFGAPVHGFALSKGMDTYLSQIPSLQGKTVACFVTKGLPFAGTGGNQAIARMRQVCESRGATVCATGIVIWRGQREKQIADLVERFRRCFEGGR